MLVEPLLELPPIGPLLAPYYHPLLCVCVLSFFSRTS